MISYISTPFKCKHISLYMLCLTNNSLFGIITPFGGVKQSGYGKDLSLHSFNKYTSLKTRWIKYTA